MKADAPPFDSLELEMCFLAECQLATLEWLRGRKTSGKKRVERAERIATRAVQACERFCPAACFHRRAWGAYAFPRLVAEMKD